MAAYDDVLDITWLTDANALGSGTWDQMNTAAANYTLDFGLLTFDDWRLASMSVVAPVPVGETYPRTTSVQNCRTETELNCRDNELGYMFYHNLEGTYGTSETGPQTVGDVTLTDIQTGYWSGTEYDSVRAWGVGLSYGNQLVGTKINLNLSGWAVRSGDVVGVPEPGTGPLLAAGLLGVGFARKSRAH